MIKIAICDDEPETRAYLASLIRAQPYQCEITEHCSAAGLLKSRSEADLLLLDIELAPGRPDGMDLAREIRAVAPGPLPVLIFVTGYERYVFDAFDVGAFQYLLKPIDEDRFAQVFARAAEMITATGEKPCRAITLQFANTTRTIPLKSIYYVESSNHKVILHLTDGKFTSYTKLSDLELQLHDRFFRVHKGYLVNLEYVEGYNKTELTLANGERLLLSKYKYKDFVRAYLRFLKGGDML